MGCHPWAPAVFLQQTPGQDGPEVLYGTTSLTVVFSRPVIALGEDFGRWGRKGKGEVPDNFLPTSCPPTVQQLTTSLHQHLPVGGVFFLPESSPSPNPHAEPTGAVVNTPIGRPLVLSVRSRGGDGSWTPPVPAGRMRWVTTYALRRCCQW